MHRKSDRAGSSREPQTRSPAHSCGQEDTLKTSERFVLAHPVEGGNQWWEVNDMEKQYAVVTVQASVPHAEEIARFAYSKIVDEAGR